MQAEQGWHYNTEKYREAITNEVQCKVPLEDGWGKKPFHDKEKMRKEYNEYCPKSKSKSKSNFVFCPREIIEKKTNREEKEEVQWINDYFKKVGKKSRKKKSKRKGKDYHVNCQKERKKKKTKKKGRRGKRKKTKKRSKRGRKKKTKRKRKRRKRKRSKKKKTKKKG